MIELHKMTLNNICCEDFGSNLGMPTCKLRSFMHLFWSHDKWQVLFSGSSIWDKCFVAIPSDGVSGSQNSCPQFCTGFCFKQNNAHINQELLKCLKWERKIPWEKWWQEEWISVDRERAQGIFWWGQQNARIRAQNVPTRVPTGSDDYLFLTLMEDTHYPLLVASHAWRAFR